MSKSRRILKKVGITVAVIFALLVVTAAVLPFIINVDDYRPQIVQAVNDKINGKFELGKLQLTLWGKIKIQVDGFSLKDAQARTVVAAKDVYFHVPWLSIFSGAPLLNFKLEKPEVQVIKDKSGKMNVMSLMKPAEKPAEAAPAAPAGGKTSIPGIAARARLGVEMKDARMSYKDAATGLSTEVKDLNVVAKDLSLSRPMEIEAWANLDTKMGTMIVRGPIRFGAKADPKFQDGALQQAKVELRADLDDLEIIMGELFHKKKGMATNASSTLEVSPTTAKLASAVAKFFNAEVKASGEVTNLGAETSPVVNISFKSNDISLAPWAELVPMLREYKLAGSASLAGGANGPTDQLGYRADGAIKALTAKAPNLKAEPRIDAGIKIVTDQVESMSMTMKAPGNELRVSGKVASFKAPKIDVQVTSPGMDLDQLIEFPKPAKKDVGKSSSPQTADSGKPGDGKPAEDMDAALDALRKNEVAAATRANIVFNLALLKAYGVKMTDMNGAMSFRDLGFYIDRFKMGLWNGSVSANAGIQMKPKTPTYRFTGEVASLDLKQAVASQFELFKNTLLGNANFKMEASGASFNPEPAKKSLNAKGNMRVTNATFATIDIARMAKEAINKAIEGAAAKIPQLKGQTVKGEANTESKYESVTADFTIANGVFSAPNFFAKSEPNRGIDVKGNTQLNIINYGLNAQWELVDQHNLLKARDVSVEQSGVRVERLLVEGDKPLTLPITVTGTAFEPKPNYGSVPEAIAKVALGNVQRAVEGKVKAEAQKKAQAEADKLIQKAPPKAQEALKGLGKKLFGN